MDEDIWVSRKRKLSDLPSPNLSLDDAIELFRERLEGWLLDPADTIEKEHGGFAIVAATFPFIETFGQVLSGKSTHIKLKGNAADTPHGQLCYIDAEEAFAQGLRRISAEVGCPIKKSVAKTLFKTLRCGVLHNASPTADAYIEGQDDLIEFREVRGRQVTVVDPHRLLRACKDVARDLDRFVKEDDQTKKSFARIFDTYVGEKFGLTVTP